MARVSAWCGAAVLFAGLGIALLCGASVAFANPETDSRVGSETGSVAVSGVARGSDDTDPPTPAPGVSRGKTDIAAAADEADAEDQQIESAAPRRIQVAAARTSPNPAEAVVDALLGAAQAFLPEPEDSGR